MSLLLLTLSFGILRSTETPALQPFLTNSSNIQSFYLDIQNCSKLNIHANKGFHFRGAAVAILQNPTEQSQSRFDLIRMYKSVRHVCLEMHLEHMTTPAFNTLVLTATCNFTTVQMFGIENYGDVCSKLVVNEIVSRENCLPLGGRVQIECDGANYMVVETKFGDILAVSNGATPAAIGLDNVERIETRFGVDMWQAQKDRQRDLKSTKCSCDAFHDFSQWVLECTGRSEKPKRNVTRVTRTSRNSNKLATVLLVIALLALLLTVVYHAVEDWRHPANMKIGV